MFQANLLGDLIGGSPPATQTATPLVSPTPSVPLLPPTKPLPPNTVPDLISGVKPLIQPTSINNVPPMGLPVGAQPTLAGQPLAQNLNSTMIGGPSMMPNQPLVGAQPLIGGPPLIPGPGMGSQPLVGQVPSSQHSVGSLISSPPQGMPAASILSQPVTSTPITAVKADTMSKPGKL